MKQFKTIETTTIVNENMQTETKTITTLHTIRNWQELSKEEKEKEIENRKEDIYYWYQEDLYNNFLLDLDYLKEQFKNIDFDTIYLDSNSQGWWIDNVKGLKYVGDNLDIYGEQLWIDSIELHIRKYIDSYDIYIEDYYIDSDKLEKIKQSKKFKNWYKKVETELQEWISQANEYCKDIGNNEYYCPYNMEDAEDKEWLDNYFENEEFETIKVIENE